jgi:hypothetical protein
MRDGWQYCWHEPTSRCECEHTLHAARVFPLTLPFAKPLSFAIIVVSPAARAAFSILPKSERVNHLCSKT